MIRFVVLPVLFLGLAKNVVAEDPWRPVASFPFESGWLVAARDSGQLLHFDEAGQLTKKQKVADRIVDGVRMDESRFVIADETDSCIKLLKYSGNRFEILNSIDLPIYPIRIAVSTNQKYVAVSLLWARQLALFEFDAATNRLQLARTVNLSFAPQELCFLDHGRVLVADAFGANLALVVTSTGSIEKQVTIPGHNIRGLALNSRGQLLISHQLLNGFVPTSRDHVFWGNIVSNLLRTINVADIRKARDGQRIHGRIVPLGESNRAAGDPGRIAVTSSGYTVVALSGVHEIAVRGPKSREFKRIKVGRKPSQIDELPNGRVLVTNAFDDHLSIVDLRKGEVAKSLLINRDVSKTSVGRGEELFYDATLSLDGWFSCHSCHSDGHSPDLLNDNLGDDTFGQPKRILSLLGVNQSAPWAWDGSQFNLIDQVQKSLYQTMHAADRKQVLTEDVMAITTYVRTLKSAPSLHTARRNNDTAGLLRGQQVFRDHGCIDCHQPANFTSTTVQPIGIADDKIKELNPPSLVGVSQRSRLFHDARAHSLRDAMTTHDHHGASTLSAKQLDDLLSYLISL